jgi:hypothetical protein
MWKELPIESMGFSWFYGTLPCSKDPAKLYIVHLNVVDGNLESIFIDKAGNTTYINDFDDFYTIKGVHKAVEIPRVDPATIKERVLQDMDWIRTKATEEECKKIYETMLTCQLQRQLLSQATAATTIVDGWVCDTKGMPIRITID